MTSTLLEPETMGRVLTEATIENLEDLWAAKRGLVSPEDVRRIVVADALVDMRYQVVLHRTDEGISVSVPALPGCWSEGDTDEEALANIRDAIDDYLAAIQDQYREAEVREVEVGV
jgi:predicted RNase H-like HicB family nuclease